MTLTLVCLHGFTQNGPLLAQQLDAISQRLAPDVRVVCPDAPHLCKPESVRRMAAAFRMPEPPPPHCCWWDASEDGSEYRGWEASREALRALCAQRDATSRVGVLGFSQGAIVAAALAALQQSDLFPTLNFAILIAGRLPRAKALAPYLDTPLTLPSLHIWGERDAGAMQASPLLSEAFSASERKVLTWAGPHTIPQHGPASDAIVEWVNGFVR